jgi:hypothetical protein
MPEVKGLPLFCDGGENDFFARPPHTAWLEGGPKRLTRAGSSASLCLAGRRAKGTEFRLFLKRQISNLSIYISTVSNDYDVYRTVIVINLIYDAVLADSEPPQSHNAAELFATCRTSVFSKILDLFQNPLGYICWKGLKFFSGRSCEGDFVYRHLRSF